MTYQGCSTQEMGIWFCKLKHFTQMIPWRGSVQLQSSDETVGDLLDQSSCTFVFRLSVVALLQRHGFILSSNFPRNRRALNDRLRHQISGLANRWKPGLRNCPGWWIRHFKSESAWFLRYTTFRETFSSFSLHPRSCNDLYRQQCAK